MFNTAHALRKAAIRGHFRPYVARVIQRAYAKGRIRLDDGFAYVMQPCPDKGCTCGGSVLFTGHLVK